MNKVYQLDPSRDDWLIDQVMRREPTTLIIDARSAEWKGRAFKAKYGQRCRYGGRFLGNASKGSPVRLANPMTGIATVIQYLNEGHNLVLLTDDDDHQQAIVTLLAASCPEVEIVARENVPADPVIIVCMRGKPSKPRTRMTDVGSHVYASINGDEVPGVVLESHPSPNGDYRDCKIKVAAYNAISRQWLVSTYPKPVQSHRLRLRYKDVPELDQDPCKKVQ
jgi:hypothetical protein